MNTIERLDALKNFAHEIGFLYYGANDYKENYVSDMYYMIKRFLLMRLKFWSITRIRNIVRRLRKVLLIISIMPPNI